MDCTDVFSRFRHWNQCSSRRRYIRIKSEQAARRSNQEVATRQIAEYMDIYRSGYPSRCRRVRIEAKQAVRRLNQEAATRQITLCANDDGTFTPRKITL